MKLSIVIICWNDLEVIDGCLESIFSRTKDLEFEVIVSDNGSTDDSIKHIRRKFPSVHVVENGANLGFARGNNAGINVARGKYTLILNPDTIILDHALEKLVAFAECHPEAGAFGCRVLNPDGSFQTPARPLPSLPGYFAAALHARWLARISSVFVSDVYIGWDGTNERLIGFQSGCCILINTELLRRLGGFDERFFYHYEESDLCRRIWKAGSKVIFCPEAEIIHLGGQSVGRFPIRFALETQRSGYRYFCKHSGVRAARWFRWVKLLHYLVRLIGYGAWSLLRPDPVTTSRLAMYRVLLSWNWRLNPVRFLETGEEPGSGYEPLAPAPWMFTTSLHAKGTQKTI